MGEGGYDADVSISHAVVHKKLENGIGYHLLHDQRQYETCGVLNVKLLPVALDRVLERDILL
jgi:hypothetical protein